MRQLLFSLTHMPSKKLIKEPSFVVDTYKAGDSGKFVAAAIEFLGKRRVRALRWKDKQFPSQLEADQYVRKQFSKQGISEMESIGTWSYGR